MTRTITIDPVTRIEGHARVEVEVDDAGQVVQSLFKVMDFRGNGNGKKGSVRRYATGLWVQTDEGEDIVFAISSHFPVSRARFDQAPGERVGQGARSGFIYFASVIAFVCRDGIERRRIGLCALLFVGAAMFWSGFEQAGSSLNLFASRNTQLPNDGFFTITASQTQSFNAGFILIFAPIFSALWAFLGRRNLDPNPSLKFGLGLIQL